MNIIYRKLLFIVVLGLLIPQLGFAARDNSLSDKIDKLDDEASENMYIPVVFGVAVAHLTDTWGVARSNGRTHEGVDIMAPRGTLIASPTEAVVTKIADQGLGGIQVWTSNPGDQKFYYAHLNGVYPDLEVGDELDPGDIIGFVGNTGNASGGAPHLHLGIYEDGYNAINPYPFFTKEFSKEQRIDVIMQYVEYLRGELAKAIEEE